MKEAWRKHLDSQAASERSSNVSNKSVTAIIPSLECDLLTVGRFIGGSVYSSDRLTRCRCRCYEDRMFVRNERVAPRLGSRLARIDKHLYRQAQEDSILP